VAAAVRNMVVVLFGLVRLCRDLLNSAWLWFFCRWKIRSRHSHWCYNYSSSKYFCILLQKDCWPHWFQGINIWNFSSFM